MKKIVMILMIAFMCGCSINEDKYASFEHYDLRDYNHKIFSYYRTQDEEKYAVAVLSPKIGEEVIMAYEEGLLYQVSENDYILLDRFAGSDAIYENEKYTLLYKDKLYLLRGGVVFVYTLNKENTKVENLNFNMKKIIDAQVVSWKTSSIEDIDDDYIYMIGDIWWYEDATGPMSGQRWSVHMKCSLKDYVCEDDR